VTHGNAATALNNANYATDDAGRLLLPNGQTQLPCNGYGGDDVTVHTPLNNPMGHAPYDPTPLGVGDDPVGPPPPPPDDPSLCRTMPSSMAIKLNKLSVRSGLYKLVGEIGLRENIYYGSIFVCMTLIVIVCFLVINNRGGSGDAGGTASAVFDDGKNCFSRNLTRFEEY
jgi:hypothetical protein